MLQFNKFLLYFIASNFGPTLKKHSSFHHLHKLLILVYYINFVVSIARSIALVSHTTDDKDQTIFLTVMSIVASVHNYRIFLILCKKNEIIKFVHRIGIYHTKDYREFKQISHKSELFMKFAKCFTIITAIAMDCDCISCGKCDQSQETNVFQQRIPYGLD